MDQIKIREIVHQVLQDFKEPGGYVIVRAQSRREWNIQLSNGSLESSCRGYAWPIHFT